MTIMHAPFTTDIQLFLTDGEKTVKATWRLPAGRYPTKVEIDLALEEVPKQVCDELGEGWRLCSRSEFENEVIAEHTGVNIQFATKEDWDPA